MIVTATGIVTLTTADAADAEEDADAVCAVFSAAAAVAEEDAADADAGIVTGISSVRVVTETGAMRISKSDLKRESRETAAATGKEENAAERTDAVFNLNTK